ncbi:DUF2946 family protein [Thauera aromatica]|nr:DUF2946 family protein [Thauera aromatica]
MMASALAPALSRAMGPDEGGRYLIEVCSASGSRVIELPAAEAAFYRDHGVSADSGGGPQEASFEQCPYCCPHAGGAALPPAAPPALRIPEGGALLPRLFLVSPRPLFVWAPSHPRAPPARG